MFARCLESPSSFVNVETSLRDDGPRYAVAVVAGQRKKEKVTVDVDGLCAVNPDQL